MDKRRVVVVGGGIAGVSAAYALSTRGHDVVLLEMESHLAYHTTGRSAALYLESYGHSAVRPLTRASRLVLENPPPDLVDTPLLGRMRGALTVARRGQEIELGHHAAELRSAGGRMEELSPEQVVTIVPEMRGDLLIGGLLEPEATDIDVAGLHQMFVRGIRKSGGTIRTTSQVVGMEPVSDGWRISTPDQTLVADEVVNACGAWGDRLAALAGIPPVGLVPKRRTAFMVPGDDRREHWPLVIGVAHDFYFKPDGSQLLCSPAEEEPDEPGDPRPRPEDIALAIDTINQITTLGIRSVRSSWTGLRTFAPDGSMVIGPEPTAPGFNWLVGQGGTGIQSSAAAGELLAGLIGEGRAPEHVPGVDLGALLPDRFR